MKNFLLLTAFLLSLFMNAQIINFPDANFKARLLAANTTNDIATNASGNSIKIDVNNDGEIQVAEAQNVRSLNVQGSLIQSLIGIQSFSNIRELICAFNSLTSLDLQGLTALEYLDFSTNQVSSINLNGLLFLKTLHCPFNQLTSINISGLISLQLIYCHSNLLTSLNTTGLTNLDFVVCNHNNIQTLDFSTNTSLTNLICNNNQLTSLNANLPNLGLLDCSYNQLTVLDISITASLGHLSCENNLLNTILFHNNNYVEYIDCSYNQLTFLLLPFNILNVLICSFNSIQTLNLEHLTINDLACNNNQLIELKIKNGHSESFINFNFNPNLAYVCADEGELSLVQLLTTSYGYTNCVVDSNCALSNQNFNLAEAFSISPNPVKDILTIDTTIGMTTINIYNALGQLVKTIANAKDTKTIDVANFNNGNYFMKIETSDGVVTQKFIKI